MDQVVVVHSIRGHETRPRKEVDVMPSAEVIAQKLRDLRGERSREEVAATLHISVSALSMYENGARIPRDEIKVALARFYDTTVGELFFGQ